MKQKQTKNPKTIHLSELIKQAEQDPVRKARIAYFRRMYNMTLVIKEARRSIGLSQVDLAIKSGVPQATISKIEAGKRNMTLETLDQLAQAMGKELKIVIS